MLVQEEELREHSYNVTQRVDLKSGVPGTYKDDDEGNDSKLALVEITAKLPASLSRALSLTIIKTHHDASEKASEQEYSESACHSQEKGRKLKGHYSQDARFGKQRCGTEVQQQRPQVPLTRSVSMPSCWQRSKTHWESGLWNQREVSLLGTRGRQTGRSIIQHHGYWQDERGIRESVMGRRREHSWLACSTCGCESLHAVALVHECALEDFARVDFSPFFLQQSHPDQRTSSSALFFPPANLHPSRRLAVRVSLSRRTPFQCRPPSAILPTIPIGPRDTWRYAAASTQTAHLPAAYHIPIAMHIHLPSAAHNLADESERQSQGQAKRGTGNRTEPNQTKQQAADGLDQA
ncbi:hypothetical protein IWX90DRAFT_506944 [Phyllosticta citrichinensis]|uniref:Uncharacterized protein n=1 Tax=Phyllosticta citrichinensis TaxID=1130410 RepID=A0ABR1XPB2_9PEZI